MSLVPLCRATVLNCLALSCLAWSTFACTLSVAATATDLFPDTTKAFVAITDFRALEDAWLQTLYGQFLNDPDVQPYVSAVGKARKMPWKEVFDALGIELEDLESIAGGEVAFALIPRDDGQRSLAMIVQTKEKARDVTELLATLAKRRARDQRTEPAVSSGKLTVYTPAAIAGATAPRPTCYGVATDLFVAGDDLKIVTGILERAAAPAKITLGSLPAYQWVMEQSKPTVGPTDVQLRFFVDPEGMAAFEDAATKATRDAMKGPKPKPKRSAVKGLQAHGFDAIRGAGGVGCFAVDKYDVLYHVALYAPGTHAKAMRLLDFAEGQDFVPPAIVPNNMGTCTVFHHNMRQGFESFESLFNDIFGEGEQDAFRDVIDSIRDDPDGPGVDLRKEVLDRLKQKGLLFGNHILPADPKSERTVFAVETSDEPALADAVRRLMKGDPDVVQRTVRQYVVWEVRSSSKRTDIRVPNAAICVAKGHMFIATHVELLRELLLRDDAQPMSADPTFLEVQKQMQQLGAGAGAFRIYSRTSEDYRITYELTRLGRIFESESVYGQIIQALAGHEGKKGTKQKQKVDGALLPEFEKVRQYFAPVGIFGKNIKDGQVLTGFTLRGDTK